MTLAKRRHAVRTTPPPVRESHWSTKVPVDHVTIPPSSASVDKWSQPSLALEDQWTSLGEAPEVVHPNISRPEVSVNLPFTINSLKTGNYVEKTARLESIPFSRYPLSLPLFLPLFSPLFFPLFFFCFIRVQMGRCAHSIAVHKINRQLHKLIRSTNILPQLFLFKSICHIFQGGWGAGADGQGHVFQTDRT